ncbi:hypothetical protein SD66_08615 [Enterobacter cloacae]|nr:hypothetical protein SD66_08615 [Enterobacter cloacae]
MLKEHAQDVSVVDLYDMKIIKQSEKTLVCEGLMDFSTGETGISGTFSLKDNSFGKATIFVKLNVEDEEE